MRERPVWQRVWAEVRQAIQETNHASARLAELNRIPPPRVQAPRASVPLRWERTWRGPRLVGSVLPDHRPGSAG